jgi:hypothetical protein
MSRRWGAAFAVACTGLLLMSRASEAACGDYLHVSGRSVPMVHLMQDRSAAAHDGPMNGPVDGVPRRRCHGPGCSNNSLPPQAPVPTVVVSIERGALAPNDTPHVIDGCDDMLAESVDLVVDGYRLSIFRPPR